MTAIREAQLEPTSVPEWEAEDMLAGRLAAELRPADPDEARAMLEDLRLGFPAVLDHRELGQYSAARGTPLAAELVPDAERFAFHLVEIPLTILVPEGRRLVRLRLRTELDAGDGGPAVAYDLFPPDRWRDVAHDAGEISLDVAKALTFVCPAPVGEALGLKLKLPLRWHTREAQVRTTDRLSNPVEWYVRDSSITEGFTAYLIVRAPKGAPLTVRAHLVCELRRPGPLGRILRASFRSGEERYELGAS
jgi:hypothetical protein